MRTLARFYFRLRHGAYRRRYDRLVVEELDGVRLIMLPEVFNGVVLRTGAFLARSIPPAPPDGLALDMGTGSGLGAIFAARQGYRVTAVDINPQAVRCARINVLLNRLEARVDVRQGDLFDPVAGQAFDLVLFNPPFYRGTPRNPLDRAWRAPDVFERFAQGLPAALRPGGQARIVLSTDGEAEAMLHALRSAGLEVQSAASRDLGNEVLTVYSVLAVQAAASA